MNTDPLLKFLTVPRVAAELDVDKATVYRLIAAGELPCVRLGSGARRGQLLRVRAGDLERWIADREAKSCATA
ncbi:MAG TPA: helix-turn-helix domain-containing protein [Gaiellales bacterium]|nr:helix-turn-helix domain-containing protein [Gaiellales bacterium]